MKIIEALTECANGKNFENCKMKYKEMEFERFNEYEIYDDLYDEEITLNDEIEIIEEVENKEYEDIEEINGDYVVPNTPATENEAYIMACFLAHEQIINALIRNQKYILERLDK